MADEKKKGQSEVEAFLAKHKDRLEKFRRINEEAEEEREEIALRKAEHPEMNDPDYQIAVVDRFIKDNPDVPHVTVGDEPDDND